MMGIYFKRSTTLEDEILVYITVQTKALLE